jgi:hypothetical protein
MVAELQEQLLAWERELDGWEVALMAWEDGLAASECALRWAHMACDSERDQAKTVRQGYRARMCAHTPSCQCSFDFDRVLTGHMFILSVHEVDLEWWEEKLATEQAQGLYPFDGRDILVELEELREHMARVENEHDVEAVQLSRLVMEISDALVGLGLSPIWGIPAHPTSAQDVLTMANLIMEHMWKNMPPTRVPGSKTCLSGAATTAGYPIYHLYYFCFWHVCNVHVYTTKILKNLCPYIPASLHFWPKCAGVLWLRLDMRCIPGGGRPS